MLSPGGALFIGASESLYGISSKFTAVHHGDSVYYQ
jgi:chemotaxis methyl-accepting protein methylase